MAIHFVWIMVGLAALIVGGELLVRGSSLLATAARISPLAIGLTVVAFGTSAPELAVSLQASFAGRADIAVGNVVGSNIFNVLLILGASAAMTPLLVSSQLVRRDVPLMIAASLAVVLMSLNGRIDRWEGFILFGCLIAYTCFSLISSRRESLGTDLLRNVEPPSIPKPTILLHVAYIVIGLVFLAMGARWLVEAAATIAREWGISELTIGLTIVAMGTSLPEAVTSFVAALRGQRDIAVGNVVGSNIFNVLAVLGGTACCSAGGVQVSQAAIEFDLPIMLAVSIACLPIFMTGHSITRWEGVLLLAYFVAYNAYILLVAVNSTVVRSFTVMMAFAVPLTVLVLGTNLWLEYRRRSRARGPVDS